MASKNGGHATGAAKDEAELRQRNVASYEKANGQQVYKIEAEDTKKLQKVRSISLSKISQSSNGGSTAPGEHLAIPRRMGVPDRTHHLHSICPIYQTMADWTVSHRHLG